MTKESSIICLSGAADPIHVGHIRYIKDASKYGKIIWILNSDEWCKRKKGYLVMPWEERAEVLMSIKGIYKVVKVSDLMGGTVEEALKEIRPDYFGKGGDSDETNTPESRICKELGIECVYGLGGDKRYSSSTIINNVVREIDSKFNKVLK